MRLKSLCLRKILFKFIRFVVYMLVYFHVNVLVKLIDEFRSENINNNSYSCLTCVFDFFFILNDFISFIGLYVHVHLHLEILKT